MRTFLLLILGFVFCAASLMSCQSNSAPDDESSQATSIPFRKDGTLDFIRAGDMYQTIDIEIAETDSAIIRGMMQRTSLPEHSGMLFLMPEEELQEFWMSNTQISLDIIFANAEREIVHIAKYTTPLSQENVKSIYPAQYIIEVQAGVADSYGILEGDRFDWRRE